jgi:hypothetical protein
MPGEALGLPKTSPQTSGHALNLRGYELYQLFVSELQEPDDLLKVHDPRAALQRRVSCIRVHLRLMFFLRT